jgi:hypothetical protein
VHLARVIPPMLSAYITLSVLGTQEVGRQVEGSGLFAVCMSRWHVVWCRGGMSCTLQLCSCPRGHETSRRACNPLGIGVSYSDCGAGLLCVVFRRVQRLWVACVRL